MNAAHLHLVLNHAPVFGVLFALVLLGLARLRHSDQLARIGLGTLVVSGLAAAGAMFTGEPAEHAVEHLAGISERAIEAHEEAAELAAAVTYAGAVIALAALLLRRRIALADRLTLLALVAALAAFSLMARTANLGGQIRHPEIVGTGLVEPTAAFSTQATTLTSAESEHDGGYD
jgi:hypothetical protein